MGTELLKFITVGKEGSREKRGLLLGAIILVLGILQTLVGDAGADSAIELKTGALLLYGIYVTWRRRQALDRVEGATPTKITMDGKLKSLLIPLLLCLGLMAGPVSMTGCASTIPVNTQHGIVMVKADWEKSIAYALGTTSIVFQEYQDTKVGEVGILKAENRFDDAVQLADKFEFIDNKVRASQAALLRSYGNYLHGKTAFNKRELEKSIRLLASQLQVAIEFADEWGFEVPPLMKSLIPTLEGLS